MSKGFTVIGVPISYEHLIGAFKCIFIFISLSQAMKTKLKYLLIIYDLDFLFLGTSFNKTLPDINLIISILILLFLLRF